MTKKVKYPRTYHLPDSPGVSSDDKIISSFDKLVGKEIVVTLKMDGENTTIYNDAVHARSLDSAAHPSRTWIRQFQGQIGHSIPEGTRICGENLFAKHSIHYLELPSYFMAFSVWTDAKCWSWDETEIFCQERGIEMVPVIYRGVFDLKKIYEAFEPYKSQHEGFVVRLTEAFTLDDFSTSCAKWVRKGHVGTSSHWMHQEVVKNKLKS